MAEPLSAAACRIAVVGFGHPDRCDDRLGWHAVEQLARRGWEGKVALVARHQLEIEDAETVAGLDRVVFVDARVDDPNGPPRRDWELAPIAARVESTAISHCLTPATVLALAEALYGRAPAEAWLGTARAYRLDFGRELSAPALAAAESLIGEIEALLGRWLDPSAGERAPAQVPSRCTSSR